jgi:hypothetical protein
VTVRVVDCDGTTFVPVAVEDCSEAKAELNTDNAFVVPAVVEAPADGVADVSIDVVADTPATGVVDPVESVRDAKAELKTVNALVVPGVVVAEVVETGTTATPVPEEAGEATELVTDSAEERADVAVLAAD